MRKETFTAIADQIERRITSDPSYRLPRLVDLAVQCRVSYPTMWKALQLLVRKGLVRSVGGRRLVVAANVSEHDSPHDRLYRTIKHRIQDGIYKARQPLPKSGYFAATESTSYLTVSRVFSALAAETLVHKRGNRWHAGPAPAMSGPGSTSAASPVIVAVLEQALPLSGFFGDTFTDRFMEPFVHEAASYGFQIRTGLLSGQSGSAIAMPTGPARIRTFVRELGNRYRGALIRRMDPPFFPETAALIRSLAKRGRPVIYFDSTDQGGAALTRGALPAGRDYYRMHLDDQAAAMLVLGELAHRGHRVVGIHGAELADWARRRTAAIVECAASFDPPLHVAVAGPAERQWVFPGELGTVTFVEQVLDTKQMAGGALAQAGERRHALIRGASSLVSLLAEHRPTALIGLNDKIAWEYYLWCRSVGIDVPKHLSIVGFDNIAPTSLLPLSSVDWGFPRLGYLAAHIIIGDIPVRARRDGNIAGACALSGTLSIAAPGVTSELARLLKE